MDGFTLLLGLIAGAVVLALWRAVRSAKRAIEALNLGPEETEAAVRTLREVAQRARGPQRARCPRCNGPSALLPGSGRGYRCQACNLGFVGPEPAPDPGRRAG